tara:strand:+ start:1186 stop:1590 length:405 start_codon:yes stop_codon:yes gene_type:complete
MIDNPTTMRVGVAGELAVQQNLISSGYHVYTPLLDDVETDLVCETKYGFKRVQVKTITKMTTKSSIEVRMSKHKGTDRIDVLAVYYEPLNIIAYLNWDSSKESINLAINNAVNGQEKHRKYFYAYSNFPQESYD